MEGTDFSLHRAYKPPTTTSPIALLPAIQPILLYQGDCDSDLPFIAVAAKTSGKTLGTIFQLGKDSTRWMGKVGQSRDRFKNDTSSIRSKTQKDANLDTMFEKISTDLYHILGQGRFQTPETCLSRQKVLDAFTKTHHLARCWNTFGITETLRIMSRFVDEYQDFTHATTMFRGEQVSFTAFLKQCHRPPETILTPDGRSVPLSGMMSLCAAFRLLADTDALGGKGGNAGFIWIKDDNTGVIIAAQAVKIDPGFAFQFTPDGEGPSPNMLLNALHELGSTRFWLGCDGRDIQVSNYDASVSIHWEALTTEQQEQFLDALLTMEQTLTASEEELFYAFHRGGAFNRSEEEKMPKKIARDLAKKMIEWATLQTTIYREGISLRKVFFEYPTPLAHFVGREEILSRLDKELVSSTSTRVLTGLGGMGKSELASRFALQARGDFSLIYWMRSDSESNLVLSYQALAKLLGVYLEDNASLDTMRTRVHRALENRESDRPWLLIFDNAEEAFPLPQKGGSVLITSRNSDLWAEYEVIPVPPLTVEESCAFLEKELKQEKSPEMRALAERLEGIPLALSQVAAAIREEKCPVSDYLQKIEKSSPADKGVLGSVWTLMFEEIKAKNPEAFHWLLLCAFLYPENIPVAWLETWLEEGSESAQDAQEIITFLRGYHLIRVDQQLGTFSLHRLLQEALLSFAGEEKNRVAKETLQILEKRGKEFDADKVESWEKGKAWEMHARVFLSQGGSLVPSSSEIPLWRIIGSIEYSRGRGAEAVLAYSRALELLQENAEENELYLAAAFGNLARALSLAGRSQKELEYAEKALAMREKLFHGEPHPDLAISLGNMATTLSQLGQPQEALEYEKKALAMREKLFSGEPHPDLALSLGNMGAYLSALGQTQEALEYEEKALAIREKLFSGEPHPALATSLGNMGAYLSALGQTREALEYEKKALAMREKLFSGEPHPALATSLGSIGVYLSELGQTREALEYEKKALAMREKLFSGEPHPHLASSLGNMASHLSNLGQTREALEYTKKALAMREKLFSGEPHPDIASSLGNMAQLLSRLGQPQEALEYEKKALAMREKLFSGKPHPDIATLLGNLASRLSRLGQTQEALEYEEKALAMQEKLFAGEPHPDLANSLGSMANRLSRLGQTQKALEYAEKALAMHEKLFSGEPHPDLATLLENMGAYLFKLGRIQEALEYTEKALAMQEKLFSGEPHPSLAISLGNMAQLLSELGQPQEALKYAEKALAIHEKLFSGEPHPDLARSLGHMAKRLSELGQLQEALEYAERALAMNEKFFSGKSHPDFAISLGNMAHLLSELGQPQEALEYAVKALAMHEKLFSGKLHPSLAISLGNIGALLEKLGQYEKALERYQAALMIMKKLFSDENHPEISQMIQNILRIEAMKRLTYPQGSSTRHPPTGKPFSETSPLIINEKEQEDEKGCLSRCVVQ